MSPFAWIFVGVFIVPVYPHNEAAETKTACTCQQSGLGPFESSSHSSHQSGHGTFGYSGSSTESLVPSGSFGLGHYVSHAISSAAEAAGSALSPFIPNKKELESFGNSGSSSHQHISITYGHSGQDKPLGQLGTKLFEPSGVSSGNSQSSGSVGSGHYVTYTTSTTHAAEASDTMPFPHGPDEGEPDSLEPDTFGHSGSSLHQHVSITLGQSGQSKSLGQGVEQYTLNNNSGATATAETADTGLSATGEPESFGNAGSSSNQQFSITFGQSGQSKSFGQGLGQYVLHNNSIAATQTNSPQFENSEGGSVLSGSVLSGQSEPGSDQHTTVSVGLSGASSVQEGSGLIGSSVSSSVQNGTALFGPSKESSVTSESLGSGHYVTYTTSSTAQTAEAAGTRPLPVAQDVIQPISLEPVSFGLSGSNSHQEISTSFGKLGQDKSSEYGGQYSQSNNLVSNPTPELAEKIISTVGSESVSPGSRPSIESEPSSDQHVTVSVGISDVALDQPQHGTVESSESSAAQYGTTLLGASKVNSETPTSSESFASGPYLKYTTSTIQAAEEPEAKPFPNESDAGGSNHFEHSNYNSNHQVPVAFGQLGQSQSVGQELGQYTSYNKSIKTEVVEAGDAKPSQLELEGGGSILSGQSESSSDHRVKVSAGISTTSSDQPGSVPLDILGSNSDLHENKLFEPSEPNTGTSQSESIGSEHYVKYTTSSTVQTAEGTETRPFPNRPDGDGSGLLGLPGSHQNLSVTYGQSGQGQSLGVGVGQYTQYSQSVAAETKPSHIGTDTGESVPYASNLFQQSEPNSDQQVTVSIGLSGDRPNQQGYDQAGKPGYSSVLNGTGWYGSSGDIYGTSTNSGSFGSGQYLKYATSSVGQMTTTPENGQLAIEVNKGGLVPLGNSESSSNQHISISAGQLGESKLPVYDLGHYNQFSSSEVLQTKLSQFPSNGGEAVSTGYETFGQPGLNTYKQTSSSVDQYVTSSKQPESDPVGLPGYNSIQNGSILLEPSKSTPDSSPSFGSKKILFSTSSKSQTAEGPETRPSSFELNTGGPDLFATGPLGQSGSSINHHVSVTFENLGPSKTFGESQGQYYQYSNSGAAETKPAQFGQNGGMAVSSGTVLFEQPGFKSYHQISGSTTPYDNSSNLPGHGPIPPSISTQNGSKPIESSEANSVISSGSFGSGHYSKYTTSSVSQTVEEPETIPMSIGSDIAGPSPIVPGPFGLSGSNSDQHVSITFGQQGDNKAFGAGLGQFNQYINSGTTITKPFQSGTDVGGGMSSESVNFDQTLPNSFQQTSGSIGQHTISTDQSGHELVWSSGSNFGQSESKLFQEPSDTSSSTYSSTGSFGSGNHLKYTTSSIGQTAEEPETGSTSFEPGLGGPSSFSPGTLGQPMSTSNQQVSLTSGQPGQTLPIGEGLGQYNQYSNSLAFEQQVPNSNQQMSGSIGQYNIGSDQLGSVPVISSGSSLDQSGIRLFEEPSEANSGTSLSTGSFGSGNYLKYATSSVGQMAEEPETGSSSTGINIGGSGPFAPGSFGESASSSSPYMSVTSGQLGQSFGVPGQYNQYTKPVVTDTKPSQFVSDEGVVGSSGSENLGQPGTSSYQQISGSFGSYAPISNQVEQGSSRPLEFNSAQDGAGLIGSSEPSSKASTKDGSLGSGHYMAHTTSSISQSAEARPYPSEVDGGRPGLSGHGVFGHPGYVSNQQVSVTFGHSDQNKLLGQGLAQYAPYSNSVESAAEAVETNPAEFRPDEKGSVSTESISFGQPATVSYQRIPGSVVPSDKSLNQLGSRPVEISGSNSEKYEAGKFGTLTGSDQPGRYPVGPSGPDQLGRYPVGPSGPFSVQLGAEQFIPSDASSGTHTSSGSFGAGNYATFAPSAAVMETGTLPIRQDGGGQFGQSGYSSQQHVSVNFGQSGPITSEQGLEHYIPYVNPRPAATAELTEAKHSQFESNGNEKVPSGSVSFWPQRPSSDQQFSGSIGSLRPTLNLPGDELFGPSKANLGTSTSTGSFGSGNNLKYSTSLEAQTTETGSSPKKTDVELGSSGLSEYNSHQQVSPNFGQSGNSATEAITAAAAEIKPSLYGPYTEAFATSELRPSVSSEIITNHPDHNTLEATGTSSGSGLQGTTTGIFKPEESIGSGPYVRYTAPSSTLMAEETLKKPLTFVTQGERPDSTGFIPFRPSEYGSYKPVYVPLNSYGPSADHSEYKSFGLSSSLLNQPVTGLHETSQQSIEPPGTNEILGQGSYVPYTISSAEEFGTGRPNPGSFGLTGSNNVISVQNGPFGLGPGLYVPYRNAKGASMAAIAQADPSTHEPHRGGAYSSVYSSDIPALNFIGPSTPNSHEPSASESTVVPESSDQFGSGPGLYVPYRKAVGASMAAIAQAEPPRMSLSNSYEPFTSKNPVVPESGGQSGSGLYNSGTPQEATTVAAVSPADKKAVLKSASRLSSLLTTARVSTVITYFLPSGRFNSSSLSKVISYLIKSISESLPGLSGNEMLLQVLLEVISSLMHILSSASVGQVGTCPSSSSSLVGQSLTHALGS